MRLYVKVDDNSKTFTLKGVRTVTNMLFPEQNIKITDGRKFSHLKGVPIENVDNEKAVLLIGQDNNDL